jgi:DNA replication licensing factor MCM5
LLYERIIASPLETTKIMEDSVRLYLKHHNGEFADPEDDCWWQIALRSDELPRRLREVDSSLVSKLFSVSGIVITATKPYIKASKLRLQCKSCQSIKIIELAPGQNPYVPIFCSGQEGARQKCPSDPYVALPDSEVIDAQTIKIQENP